MYKQRDFETLWAKYEGLLKSLKNENINKLLEEQGQRIIMTSFSQREKEPFCGIGGIVDYSLKLAKNSNAIHKALNYDLNKGSIVKCSLLSIIGRIGSVYEDRFKETTSDWHKEKLWVFTIKVILSPSSPRVSNRRLWSHSLRVPKYDWPPYR